MKSKLKEVDSIARSVREDSALIEASYGSASTGKHSQRLPDPDKLSDGIYPTWKDWIGKIWANLAINQDHFNDENARIGYVLSRLDGRASDHTISRSPYDASINPYRTANEVLIDLEEICQDPDRVENYRREYFAPGAS